MKTLFILLLSFLCIGNDKPIVTTSCERDFLITGWDINGVDCTIPIFVYKKVSGNWVFQFVMYNNTPVTGVTVNYAEEWKWELSWCDGAVTPDDCVRFYLTEDGCETPDQVEFTWDACPPNEADPKLTIDKTLYHHQGNQVCDACPD